MRTLFAAAILTAATAAAQPVLPAKAKQVMAEMGHGEGTLRVGDVAPDFELKRAKAGESVRLSAFRGKKPVALVFGSFT
jgi:hypothetical protein